MKILPEILKISAGDVQNKFMETSNKILESYNFSSGWAKNYHGNFIYSSL